MTAHSSRRLLLLASCAALAAWLGAVLVACVAGAAREPGRGGWWSEDGPLVPHETFPADCTLCHTGEDWITIREDLDYDHEAETGVPLNGAHARARCLRCHNDRGPIETFTARGCAGCHPDVHEGDLGSNCESCHGETDWRPSDAIRMHARTRMPLVGAHAAAACWRCHEGALVGNFLPLDTACETCHDDDLARATDPDHVAQGWTTDCGRCHIETDWRSGFDHGFFPLTGGHALADCAGCHVSGVFVRLSPVCVSCHLADFEAARDPDHSGPGFSTDCERCHGIVTWEGAIFDHRGIVNGCVDCHLDDYLATTRPNHVMKALPFSCWVCHSVQRWAPSTFTHEGFALTGFHGFLACFDCHYAKPDWRPYSCITCHPHHERIMAKAHEDVRGYVWEDHACVRCHPDGDPDRRPR